MLAGTPTDPASLLPTLGPIALTAGLGMAALYVLLPRPKAFPRLLGAALAVLALVAAALLIVRATRVGVEAILFYAFSGLALVSGGVMITRHNPARAALAFAVVVLSTCGLFLLQAAPFLMAGTVIVYAGAIVVTFLFVLMLAQPDGLSDADQRSREPLLATLAGFFLLCTLLLVLRQTYNTDEFDALLARIDQARQQATPQAVWQVLGEDEEFRAEAEAALRKTFGRSPEAAEMTEVIRQKDDIPNVADPARANPAQLRAWLDRLRDAGERLRPRAARAAGRLQPPDRALLSPFAGTPANKPPRPLAAENVAGLGRALFTDYLLAVELGGTLLLVAAIGAIAITHRPAARRST
jgi:NADH:ubiquinone oxidoreductase subunit 6 (subunit J)